MALIHKWSMDEVVAGKVEDSVGGLDGTIYGATLTANGVSPSTGGILAGNCMSFDGNDYIELNGSTLYDIVSGGSFTVSIWLEDTATTVGYMFSDGINAELTFGIVFSGGDCDTRMLTENGVEGSGLFYLHDGWNHIVVTYDSVTRKLIQYSDGVFHAETTLTAAWINNDWKSLTIGRPGLYGGYYFNGKADEVSIYDEVLSANDVLLLNNSEALTVPTHPCTWYVRPRQSTPYGEGWSSTKGLTYETAFNGLANYSNPSGILWDGVGILPGDTLYICDEHTDNMYIPISGESGNAIIVRGDYPSHPAHLNSAPISNATDYITFQNIEFDSFSIATQLYTATNITFNNCNMNTPGAGISYVDLWSGSDNWTFDGCTFLDGANGIYTHLPGPSANHLTVRNCIFTNMDDGVGDSHAVGIQGGHGHIIEDNYCENTGAAILFYNTGNDGYQMGGHIIRRNFIKNTTSDAMGCGITVYDLMESADYDVAEDDYIIDDNIILNVWGGGIYLSTLESRPFKIRNNTIVGVGDDGYREGIGVHTTTQNIVGEIYNNIIVNPSLKFLSYSGLDSDFSDLLVDYNIYYASSAMQWNAYTAFENYQIGSGYDRHGLNTDPLFVVSSPTTADDCQLQVFSPALNVGYNYGQTVDYYNHTIGGLPDIGAINMQQYDDTGNFPTWTQYITSRTVASTIMRRLATNYILLQSQLRNAMGAYGSFEGYIKSTFTSSGSLIPELFSHAIISNIATNQHHLKYHATSHVTATDLIPIVTSTNPGLISTTLYKRVYDTVSGATPRPIIASNYIGNGSHVYVNLGFQPKLLKIFQTGSNGFVFDLVWADRTEGLIRHCLTHRRADPPAGPHQFISQSNATNKMATCGLLGFTAHNSAAINLANYNYLAVG